MKDQNLIPHGEARTRSQWINTVLAVWKRIDIMFSWKCDNCQYEKIQKEGKISCMKQNWYNVFTEMWWLSIWEISERRENSQQASFGN